MLCILHCSGYIECTESLFSLWETSQYLLMEVNYSLIILEIKKRERERGREGERGVFERGDVKERERDQTRG